LFGIHAYITAPGKNLTIGEDSRRSTEGRGVINTNHEAEEGVYCLYTFFCISPTS